MVTLTPGSTPPDASVMVPRMVPVVSCARADIAETDKITSAKPTTCRIPIIDTPLKGCEYIRLESRRRFTMRRFLRASVVLVLALVAVSRVQTAALPGYGN